MNRILKRPMFRIGGSTGTGITSGLDQPRKQYTGGGSDRMMSDAEKEERAYNLMRDSFDREQFLKERKRQMEIDKKRLEEKRKGVAVADGGRIGYANGTPNFQFAGMPGFLTSFGLNLLSTPPQGNIFQTAATAARDPFNQLMANQAALKKTESDRAFQRELLQEELEGKKEIAAMKQKDQFFAAQTPEEQFRERLKVYGESTIPVIKNNATDIANFEVKHRNENYVQLDFIYDRGTKQFQPDFRSIPEGALTYNPQDGLAYRNEGGQFIKLNPFTLEPIKSIDGTE